MTMTMTMTAVLFQMFGCYLNTRIATPFCCHKHKDTFDSCQSQERDMKENFIMHMFFTMTRNTPCQTKRNETKKKGEVCLVNEGVGQ